jgi:dihydrofolate reductase
MVRIIIIAAVAKNRVIGKDNKLPWHISEDLKNFKRLTTGNTVLMGRKTFQSIGKPLPNRHNIVISRSMPATSGVDVCRSVEEGLQKARSYGRDVFIIGGANLYQEMLPYADMMYISYVKGDYEGDVYFPEFNEEDWAVEGKEDHSEFELIVYVRKRPTRNLKLETFRRKRGDLSSDQ